MSGTPGAVNFSAICASEEIAERRPIGSIKLQKSARKALGRDASSVPATKRSIAASYEPLGLLQLVFFFAFAHRLDHISADAFRRAPTASASVGANPGGHTPTNV